MVSSVSVKNRPAKPIFIYDGNCRFCSRWVALWRESTEGRVAFHASQEIEVVSQFPEIAPAEYDRSSQFVDTDGRIYSGAEAVFRMFRHAHGKGWWIWAHQHVRGFEPISEWIYRLVAGHRAIFSRINRLVVPEHPPSHVAVRALFLRLLGVVYLCAFVSLWPQILGLMGGTGILPVEDLMRAATEQLTGFNRWHQLPTFCWLSASDASLTFQCAAGTLLSVLLIIGLFPALVVPLLWLLWLSLTVVGRDFMAFQWENLLLESGFLAIFLAPIAWTVRDGERPSAMAIFLFRWLLFRLMFMSGAVKLLSGDPAWRDLTALTYHFETQPLPTLLAWHANQLPSWFPAVQTGLMYAIELGLCFLIFGHRKLRLITFIALVLLQIGIALTGNYGYFNLLTIVLCVLLLDDKFLAASRKPRVRPLRVWRNVLLTSRSFIFAGATGLILIVSSIQFISVLKLKRTWSRPLIALHAWLQPFRSVNTYGLFAVMTKERPEIIVQGSNDRENWKDYTFKYKPGDPRRPPGLVAPHQPRLDWQMWFAALGSYEQNRWFTDFCLRLLQGSPTVLGLLEVNPFPEKPPRYIRALVYDYEFTTRETRARTGEYWLRKNERVYLPPVSIQP
jgi:predicted DCC family thiol-disulfide oxidoreductase YuxK